MKMPFHRLSVSLSFLAALVTYAQPQKQDQWEYSLGAGMIIAPSYLGDDDYQAVLLPDFRLSFGNRFFASVSSGLGYNVVNQSNWRIGPLLKYDFGRDEDGQKPFLSSGDDTTDLLGLGDIDRTLELGGFIEYTFESFVSKLEIRQGLNGHEGLIAELDLSYKFNTSLFQKKAFFKLGPQITFSDSAYTNTYFGVTTSQALASGLSPYNADGGILSYGLKSSVLVPLNQSFSLLMFANYNRLGQPAADSSLVQDRGSANQCLFGSFISYRF